MKYELIKVLMVCLVLEPGVAGWKPMTNPLSYGGTPNLEKLFTECNEITISYRSFLCSTTQQSY